MIALEANVPVAFESVGETLSDICPEGDKLNGTIFITKQYNITIEIIQYLGHQNYVMCGCLFFSSLALADTYLARQVGVEHVYNRCLLSSPYSSNPVQIDRKHVLNAEAREFIPVFPSTNRSEAEDFSGVELE